MKGQIISLFPFKVQVFKFVPYKKLFEFNTSGCKEAYRELAVAFFFSNSAAITVQKSLGKTSIFPFSLRKAKFKQLLNQKKMNVNNQFWFLRTEWDPRLKMRSRYTDVEEVWESKLSLSTVYTDRSGLGEAQTTLR